MTSVTETSRRRAAPALGTFERYLTLWVALCILAGIVLGRLLPAPFQALGRMTVAEVKIPVAVLISRHQGARQLRWCGPHGSSWRRQGA
jgi:hypothetical protein